MVEYWPRAQDCGRSTPLATLIAPVRAEQQATGWEYGTDRMYGSKLETLKGVHLGQQICNNQITW